MFVHETIHETTLELTKICTRLNAADLLQGRGRNTHAYTHALETNHRVFLNLESKRFYCLPDGYEIIDPSLSDIIYVLNPTFTSKVGGPAIFFSTCLLCIYAAYSDAQVIKDLETSSKEVRAYNGTLYLPGVVGLNNIKANDYCNVVLQALSHVTPIRNYFLDANSYAKIKRRPGDQNAHELLVVSYGCNQFVIRVAEI